MSARPSSAGGIDARQQAAARAWTSVALWVCVVLFASSESFSAVQTGRWLSWIAGLAFEALPPDGFDMVHVIVRKTAHFVEYAVLGLLTHRAFFLSWPRRGDAARLAGSVLLVVACASLDEGHQSFVVERTASGWDVLLDVGGALFGMLAHLVRVTDRGTLSFRESVSS